MEYLTKIDKIFLNIGLIMIKTNEYFDGKVKSLAVTTSDGPATVGVMLAGDYTFGTSSVEIMKVVYGEMEVQLPGESSFKKYKAGSEFTVQANQKFNLKLEGEAAYLCLYR